jgi:histidinol-phosphate phosphatase family protein
VRAVFLDKDGTVVENVPYNVQPERLRLLPGAADGLRRLQRAGYRLIIVSNQSGVARGLFPESDLWVIERRLRELLRSHGVILTGFHYCPHHPHGTVASYAVACSCRKPQPGMLHDASAEYGVVLPHSWMIGDRLDDVEAGRRAGCRTIHLTTSPPELERGDWRQPDATAPDLVAAARIILQRETR